MSTATASSSKFPITIAAMFWGVLAMEGVLRANQWIINWSQYTGVYEWVAVGVVGLFSIFAFVATILQIIAGVLLFICILKLWFASGNGLFWGTLKFISYCLVFGIFLFAMTGYSHRD